jgi:hypothetical protein
MHIQLEKSVSSARSPPRRGAASGFGISRIAGALAIIRLLL